MLNKEAFRTVSHPLLLVVHVGIEMRKLDGSKCYCIKKQIEPFLLSPLNKLYVTQPPHITDLYSITTNFPTNFPVRAKFLSDAIIHLKHLSILVLSHPLNIV